MRKAKNMRNLVIGVVSSTVATVLFGVYCLTTEEVSAGELSLWMALVWVVNLPIQTLAAGMGSVR